MYVAGSHRRSRRQHAKAFLRNGGPVASSTRAVHPSQGHLLSLGPEELVRDRALAHGAHERSSLHELSDRCDIASWTTRPGHHLVSDSKFGELKCGTAAGKETCLQMGEDMNQMQMHKLRCMPSTTIELPFKPAPRPCQVISCTVNAEVHGQTALMLTPGEGNFKTPKNIRVLHVDLT